MEVFQETNGQWVAMGLPFEGTSQGAEFGSAVSLSADGSILAIGTVGSGAGFLRGTVRVYQYAGGTWTQLGDTLEGGTDGERLGHALSLSDSGHRLALGGHGWSGYTGRVRVFDLVGGTWTQVGTDLFGEAASDNFGIAVDLSADGTTLAAGVPGNDDNGSGAGAVKVFRYSGGSWQPLGNSLAGTAAGDNFGNSVSLSADGKVVAAGAIGSDAGGTNSGQVQVFHLTGGAWVQYGGNINGPGAGAALGQSVSLDAAGDRVATGAPEYDGSGIGSGQVRVYEGQGGNWVPVGSALEGELYYGSFGYALGLSSDGGTLLVGAYGFTTEKAYVHALGCPECPVFAGAPAEVQVIENDCSATCAQGLLLAPSGTSCPAGSRLQYQVNGGDWLSTLPAYSATSALSIRTRCQCENDPTFFGPSSAGVTTLPVACPTGQTFGIGGVLQGSTDYEFFGDAAGLSGDGTHLVSGTKYFTSEGLESRGKVTLYRSDSTSWVPVGGPLLGEDEYWTCGSAVAISEDGTVIAFSCEEGGVEYFGQVKVFSQNGDSLVQLGQTIEGSSSFAYFGSNSVALSADGSVLAVAGASASSYERQVRVYTFNAGDWVPTGNILEADPTDYSFGENLALSADGQVLAVASPDYQLNGTSVGSVFVYLLNGGTWMPKGAAIPGSETYGGAGAGLAIDSTGNRLAVGSPEVTGNGLIGRGSVQVYDYVSGSWQPSGMTLYGDSEYALFGHSVSLSADGSRLAVGAPESKDINGNAYGSVTLFRHSGGHWLQTGASLPGPASGSFFGGVSDLSADGRQLLVSARNFNAGNLSSGQVRVYGTGCCPDLTAPAPDVQVVNSSCPSNSCTPSGGSISPIVCPQGAIAQYEVDRRAWTSEVPVYDQDGPQVFIRTRCVCEDLAALVSPPSAGVMVLPAGCGQTPPAAVGFINHCDLYLPGDLPIVIPNTTTSVITSQLMVSDSGVIRHVKVNLAVLHDYLGDIDARLVAPDGTSVLLFSRPGFPAIEDGCWERNIYVSFFDAADATAVALENTCTPTNGPDDFAISGDFRPLEDLSSLDGKQAAGTWKLIVSDYYPEDGGILMEWELLICTDTADCPGDPVSLSAAGGDHYQWLPSGDTTASLTVAPVGPTSYTVVVSKDNGCPPDTATVFVPVAPQPQPVITGNAFPCTGDSTTLLASGGIPGESYAWSNGGQLPSLALPPGSDGTFAVLVTGPNGCSASDSIVVATDLSPPTALCRDTLVYLDQAGMAWLGVQSVDNGSFDNVAITSRLLNQDTFRCDDLGFNTVSLTVQDACGQEAVCFGQVEIRDTVPPLPVCRDTLLTVAAPATATLPPALVWDAALSTDNCGTVTALSVSPGSFDCSQAGTQVVTLTCSDGSGNTATCQATLTVAVDFPAYAVSVDPDTCGEGRGVIRFELSGYGGPLSYTVDGGNSWTNTGTFGDLAAGSYLLAVRTSEIPGCSSPIQAVMVPVLGNNTITWVGTGDGQYWNDRLNWDLGHVPLPCQAVVIPGGFLVIVPAGFHAEGSTLEVQTGSDLTILPFSTLSIQPY